jgi:hypothetical protein
MNVGGLTFRRLALPVGGAVVAGLVTAAASGAAEAAVQRNPEVSAPVKAWVYNGDLRDLPKVPDWQPGDPIKEIPRRSTKVPPPVPEPPPMADPLLWLRSTAKAPNVIGPPILNFNGGGFSGVNPPDTVGDVGPIHYIQLINFSSGTQMRIYDKTNGTLVAGPIALDTLGAPAPCNAGLGDPVVLWDQLANRWLVSEFSTSGNRMCVYISQTADPVGGGWFGYAMQALSFPDYPKYGVWPDAYYAGTNESTAAAYAMDRSAMLTGAPATLQRFSVLPPLSGFGFEGIQPADADGALAPPAGSPGMFWRHRDSEAHGSPGAPDTVQYYELHVDFAVPANSTFTGPIDIPVTEFDSSLCGLTSFNCFAQPGSGVTLDPLREPIMHRAQYRNRGTHEVVVGSFVTDVDGANHGGVRWFEARKTGAGPYTLFQEGTVSPDSTDRWMSSIAMDGSGNIALGYNVVNEIAGQQVFPGLRYTGRVSTDPPGTMASEQVIVSGTASNNSNRYGDYSSLNVDPVNECTFWWTGEYNAAGTWSTRIATFTFPNPECIPVPVQLQGFAVE